MAIQMTRDQYQARYGQKPIIESKRTAIKSKSNFLSLYGGGEQGVANRLKQSVQAGAEDIQGGKFVKGVTKSALRTAGDVAGTVYAPVSEGLNLVTGGKLNEVFSGIQKNVEEGHGLVGKAVNSLTNMPWFQELVMKHPNAAEDFGRAMNLGLGAFDRGQINPKTTFSRTVEQTTVPLRPVAQIAGKTLKQSGEGLYGLTTPMQEGTKIALQNYEATQPTLMGRLKNFVTNKEEVTKPTTEANTAMRQGLMGTEWQLGVQAKKAASDLWKSNISPRLKDIKGKVNMSEFFNKIEQAIKKENPELGRQKALIEALDSFKEDYGRVSKIGLEKLQEYKEGWAEFLPDAVYKGKPIAGALKDVKNIASQKAREIIHKYVGEKGKQAYIDYGNLKAIEEAGRKSVDQLRSKGMTKQVWEFLMDKAVTPVATTLGQVLYRTGDGLELVGGRGAKKVRDVINIPVQTSGDNPRRIPIKRPMRIRAVSESRTNKIPLYGGSTAPKKFPRQMGGLGDIEY